MLAPHSALVFLFFTLIVFHPRLRCAGVYQRYQRPICPGFPRQQLDRPRAHPRGPAATRTRPIPRRQKVQGECQELFMMVRLLSGQIATGHSSILPPSIALSL
ncbi:hypothetical protein DFJ73DRAFT_214614 [Zopfochytrium polystomum]|nr:hypothetical protein DFJ73DRAFT_214614 [Zopfochytrium polystomum]